MPPSSLTRRLRRIEQNRGIGDLTHLSDAELQRRLDELDAKLPPKVRAALEPFRRAGDVAGEVALLRRMLDDEEDQPREAS